MQRRHGNRHGGFIPIMIIMIVCCYCSIIGAFASFDVETRIRNKGPLLDLSVSDLSSLISSTPRPYAVFVAFVGSSSGGIPCEHCGFIVDEFKILAEEYENALQRGDVQRRTLVICTVPIGLANRDLIQQLRLETMPSILLFLQDRTSSIEFDLRNLAPYATSFSQFLAEKLGVKIRVPLSYHKEGGQKWIPRSLEVLILSVLGFSIIFFLGHQLLRSVVDFSWKDLAGVAGILFIFFVGVSGTIFSLLREIPPFGYNPLNGDVFFAAPSLHQQFSVEGIVMGAMNILSSFLCFSVSLLFFVSISVSHTYSFLSSCDTWKLCFILNGVAVFE